MALRSVSHEDARSSAGWCRMRQRLRQFLNELKCLISGGHAEIFTLSPTEIYMRCHQCGKRSPGLRLQRMHAERETRREERW